MKPWKRVSSQQIYRNPWIAVNRDSYILPGRRVIDDYVSFIQKDVVMVMALTSNDKVLLVRQYRPGAGRFCIDLPHGFADNKEPLQKAALRELLEETGYRAGRLIPLGSFFDSNDRGRHKVHGYLAKNAVFAGKQRLDAGEQIEVLSYRMDEIESRIKDGSINSTQSVAFVLLGLKALGICAR